MLFGVVIMEKIVKKASERFPFALQNMIQTDSGRYSAGLQLLFLTIIPTLIDFKELPKYIMSFAIHVIT